MAILLASPSRDVTVAKVASNRHAGVSLPQHRCQSRKRLRVNGSL